MAAVRSDCADSSNGTPFTHSIPNQSPWVSRYAPVLQIAAWVPGRQRVYSDKPMTVSAKASASTAANWCVERVLPSATPAAAPEGTGGVNPGAPVLPGQVVDGS